MKYIILFCALSVIIFVPIETYACTLSPIASLSATPNPVCVGCEVTLDGSGSSDPDGGSPSLESTHYIKKFEWDFDYDGVPANFNADYTENAPCDGKTTHTYQTAGTYTAGLRVTDNDAAEGGPSDLSSIATCMVYVVKVNKIVENGTTNEGPLYKCLNGTVNLEAKPYPEGCSFPSNEPQWLIIEKPSGSVPSLNPSSGSSTTLSNLSKPGKYVVKARCGNNDQGDTIDIYTFGGPILYYDCAQQDYGKYLILANPANQSREEDYYADSIQPQGTSYKWEISSGSDKAHIVGSDNNNSVILKPDTEGNFTLKLTYSNGNNTCVSTLDSKVQVPDQSQSSVTCIGRDCFCASPGAIQPFMWAKLSVNYIIKDKDGTPIPNAWWDESWAGGCVTGQGDFPTDCNGSGVDYLYMWRSVYCNSSGILCTDTQIIKVSGWPISGWFWTNYITCYDGDEPLWCPYISHTVCQ